MIQMTPSDPGWIECVTGCMFAGKSEELIRRLRRCNYARQKIVAVKPSVDNRYGKVGITSHNGVTFSAVYVSDPRAILSLPGIEAASVVGIDEAQFFDESLTEVCRELAGDGKRVIVAGLDTDYRGMPFGSIPHLLAVADFVTKVHAVCTVCGGVATRSQRVVDNQATVVVGGAESYEARCRKHWSPEPVFARRESVAAMEE